MLSNIDITKIRRDKIFYLMNKNERVCRCIINNFGHILAIEKIYKPRFMPVCDRAIVKDIASTKLNIWKKNRSVGEARQDLNELFSKTGLTSSDIERANFGVSLSDSYWFLPVDEYSHLFWNDVSPYNRENQFFVFTAGIEEKPTGIITADITTRGSCPKAWLIDKKNKLNLVKMGPEDEMEMEYICLNLARYFGINCAKANLMKINDKKVLVISGFTSEDVEFLPAMYIDMIQKDSGNGDYLNYIYQIGGKAHFMRTLVWDFLMANEDNRNLLNFGVLRSNEYDDKNEKIVGKSIEGMAPLFNFDKALSIDSLYKEGDVSKLEIVDKRAFDIDEFEEKYEDIIEDLFKDQPLLTKSRKDLVLAIIKRRIKTYKEYFETGKNKDNSLDNLIDEANGNASQEIAERKDKHELVTNIPDSDALSAMQNQMMNAGLKNPHSDTHKNRHNTPKDVPAPKVQKESVTSTFDEIFKKR